MSDKRKRIGWMPVTVWGKEKPLPWINQIKESREEARRIVRARGPYLFRGTKTKVVAVWADL